MVIALKGSWRGQVGLDRPATTRAADDDGRRQTGGRRAPKVASLARVRNQEDRLDGISRTRSSLKFEPVWGARTLFSVHVQWHGGKGIRSASHPHGQWATRYDYDSRMNNIITPGKAILTHKHPHLQT